MTAAVTDATVGCTPRCWAPVPCPGCGGDLPPVGRSVAPEANLPSCCYQHRHTEVNLRHLWSEHDSTRHYHDPAGWAAHAAACDICT